MKKLLGIFLTLSVCAGITACSGMRNEDATFNGSRTGNDSQFIMEYTILNSTDSQLLELEEGDVIDAEVVSDAGKVSITIQKDGEDPVYESEDAVTDTFAIVIEESGVYEITVTGEKAEGSVSFIKRER